MQGIKVEDKKMVLRWLEINCFGYKYAKVRADILPFVQLDDRKFRAIASELIHEGNVASSSSRGYWFIPLVTSDVAEVDAILEACQERTSHALDILRGMGKIIDHWTVRRENLTKQIVMDFVDESKFTANDHIAKAEGY